MSLILWNNSFSVNIMKIDLQHQRLVDMINKLHDSMKKRESNNVLAGILNDMVAYTLVHFKSEEDLFIKFNYPAGRIHKMEHDLFIKKVEEFVGEFKSGNKILSIEVLNFLTEWLSQHIKIQDKAYTNFLNDKGIV